jgi:hypothetical protein
LLERWSETSGFPHADTSTIEMIQHPDNSQRILVAVMERGSAWPACVQHCRRFTPDSAVLAQDASESPAELANRVKKRVRALTAQGRLVTTGVIAAADVTGYEYTSARVKIALVLLQSMRRDDVQEGKLCLIGPEHMGSAARQQLMALTGMLLSELSGPPPVIDVRFGDDPSGLRYPCPHANTAALAEPAKPTFERHN